MKELFLWDQAVFVQIEKIKDYLNLTVDRLVQVIDYPLDELVFGHPLGIVYIKELVEPLYPKPIDSKKQIEVKFADIFFGISFVQIVVDKTKELELVIGHYLGHVVEILIFWVLDYRYKDPL